MRADISYNNSSYSIDLADPLDISIALRAAPANVNAWYLDPPQIVPHKIAGAPAQVSMGAPVNFNDIWFNPHSHVTHTECVGHISPEVYSVNQQLGRYFFMAALVSIRPENTGDDLVISAGQLEEALPRVPYEAVVLRTLPNGADKISRNYSHTNPPYLLEESARYLAGQGVDHLLLDLPSVDREEDQGALLAHKAFWNFGGPLRMQATITELIYVPDHIIDGLYFLNLQMAPFENDASPSRPVLYRILDQ